MNKKDKKELSRFVGGGLIFGVALGAFYDFYLGFTGTISAIGAGEGIVIGSIIGYIKVKSKITFKNKRK